ncbi:hypothetical protein GWK47_015166 [Chionoecetes opilio]|uniref:Reverse transcriptase n=1 Tax=Chionoecetes opilio TaxID=41210 RepID=A0A8J5CN31_CHIOP|nr:hypothetical protein GWK47_015166 [Chionoecetes opilio]
MQRAGPEDSAEKSKAMTIKAATPDCHLLVQDVRLPWTRVYQYLGVWIDRGLTFTTQVKYLRERTQARVNVMRAMTRTHAGPRTLCCDSSMYKPSARLWTTARRCSSRCHPPNRRGSRSSKTGHEDHAGGATLDQRLRHAERGPAGALDHQDSADWACRVAKILHQVRESAAQTKLSTVLPQGHDLSAGNTWLRRVAEAANHLLNLDQLLQEGPDRPAAFYVAPPPWQSPDSGSRHHRPYRPRHDGAAVVTGQEVLSWRTPDHCSTLQTELVAIQHALEHARHRREEMVVVHFRLQHTAGQDDGQTCCRQQHRAATPGDGGVIAAGGLVCQATAYRPLLPARQLSRADEVKLHRLRLGYRTLEELRDDFESRQCDHCGHLARHPLRHYLLSCPATAQLRQQIGGPEDDEDRAALVLRRALEDLPRLLVVVRSAPPPR